MIALAQTGAYIFISSTWDLKTEAQINQEYIMRPYLKQRKRFTLIFILKIITKPLTFRFIILNLGVLRIKYKALHILHKHILPLNFASGYISTLTLFCKTGDQT